MAKRHYADNVITKKRMIFIFSIFMILFILLCFRLGYLMIIQSPKLKEIAKAQWTNEVKISAKRGRILDTNGVELAISANVYRIDLDMNTLRQTLAAKKLTNDDIAPKISEALNMNVNDVKKILTKTLPNGLPLAFATLKRRVEKEQADKVKDLKINGIIVSADTKRYYPRNNFWHMFSDIQILMVLDLPVQNCTIIRIWQENPV